MKKITLIPAAERPEGVSDADYRAAKKKGEVTMNAVTAIEALRLGKGLYTVKPVPKPQVEIKAKEPTEMTAAELAAEMTSFGKPPRKKMTRQAAIDFVKKLREDAAKFITDDEDVGGDDEGGDE